MSKRELKKFLSQLSKEQLEEQIVEIYEKFVPVKTYFNFVFNPNEENLIKEAKLKISNEFFPATRKRPKMRRSVAQKYIKHFISLGVDPFLVADLMLYTIEISQLLSTEKVIKQEAFFKGVFSSYSQSISFMIQHSILYEFRTRVEDIKEATIAQNWNNSFEFIAIIERFDY